jgi:glycosyltransferase involved in cell wall biosynthesis
MKILIILTGGLKNDGISLGNISYFEAMERSDIIVDFLAINNVEKEILNRLKAIDCNVINIKNRNKNPIKYFFSLKKLIKKNEYNIVHAHGSSALMAVEMYAAKLAGVPVRIAHSRNTTCNNLKIDKILRPFFYKFTTDYFACGDEAGKWLFQKNKFTIIPNGKNIKLFEFSSEKRNEIRKKYNFENKFVVCHIGTFNNQKNHEFLIDIYYEFKKINPNSCLVLIGDGFLRESIENKIKKLGLTNDVIMTGVINNINEMLQAMDYMVLPSLFEGLPNVVIEAQISGLQCMISNTITKECKITNLVEFESLEAKSKIWAEKIANTQLIDRESSKEKIIAQLRSAGYDLIQDARILKDLYFKLYSKNIANN